MFMFILTGSGTYYVPASWIFAACAVLVAGWLTLAWRRAAQRKAKIRKRDDYLRAQFGLGDEGRVPAPPADVVDADLTFVVPIRFTGAEKRFKEP